MGKTIKIGGELESVASDGVVAAASAIIDYDKGKYQHVINRELTSIVNGLDAQNYVNLTAIGDDTTIAEVFTRLDITPAANTVYRVANWKGDDDTVKFQTSYFSEYSASSTNVNSLVLLTVVNRGIDDEPTVGSVNLVKSEGIAKIYGTDELFTIEDSFLQKGTGIQKKSTSGNNASVTPFLPMPQKLRYNSLVEHRLVAPLCFYNEDKEYISEIEATSGVLTKDECPEGTVYIRCSGIVGQSRLFGYTINELYNMTVDFLITDEEMDEVLDGEVAVYLTDINGNAVLDDNQRPIEII